VSRYFVAPDVPDSWAKGLAKPGHWKPAFSAHSLAHTWHPAGGFPTSVEAAFGSEATGTFAGLEFVAGIPEYKVALPGGSAASQTDLFVLARSGRGETVAIAIEGKAREPFGDKTVSEWRVGASPGKGQRLTFLLHVLGLPDDESVSETRYQLLHRTASALIEAERLNADHAVMLVHAFGEQPDENFEAFRSFAALLGAEVARGLVVRADRARRSLFLGWVEDPHPRVEARA
jgi:hypothetical protein